MKKFFFILLLILLVPSLVQAAQVTISSVTIPNWQRTGNDVQLRVFADTTFIANDGTIISVGAPGGIQSYKIFTCTVDSGLKTILINSNTLYPTTDGRDIQTARYNAFFFSTTTGEIIQPYLLNFKLPPIPTTQTWDDIIEFNSLGAPIPIDRDTYSKTQVLQLIDELRTSLMTNGVVTPPAGGTGLSITNQSGFLVALSGVFSLRTITDADVPDTITVSNYILTTARGAPNGVAPLIGSLVPVANIPDLQNLSGTLDSPSGGTGFISYAQGELLGGDAGGNLAKISANTTGTKKFLTETSSVASFTTIVAGDLPLGLGATAAANSVLVGNGTSYDVTSTPTIGALTTLNQAGITISASGGNAGELRLKDANGDAEYTGFKSPDNRASNLIIILPEGSPTNGQTLVFGTPSGGAVATTYGTPTAPGSGITEVSVDGSAIADSNTALNFLGSTSTGTIGGVGPFVGDSSGGMDRVAIRTSPDNSTILVGTGRTISGDATITGGGDLSANRTLSVASNTSTQKIEFKLDSDTVIASRKAIRFNDTATIDFTLTDDTVNTVTVTADVITSMSSHDFLSATHSDTLAHTLVGGDRGAIIAVNGSTQYALLTPTANRVVLNNGTDTVFGQVNLTTMVTGTLPTINGGTGLALDATTIQDGDLLIGSDTGNGFVRARITGSGGITINNTAGGIEIAGTGGGGTLTDVTTTQSQIFDITGTTTKNIDLKFSPGTTASGVAQTHALFPRVLGASTVTASSCLAVSTNAGVVLAEIIYVDAPIEFNTISIGVSTIAGTIASSVQTATATVGIWNAAKTTKLVDSGVITVKTLGSRSGAGLTGDASVVTAGVARLLPGYYYLVFSVTRDRNGTGTLAAAPIFTVTGHTTSFSHTALLQGGGVSTLYGGGVSTTGLQPANLSGLSAASSGATYSFPYVRLTRQ